MPKEAEMEGFFLFGGGGGMVYKVLVILALFLETFGFNIFQVFGIRDQVSGIREEGSRNREQGSGYREQKTVN